MINWSLCSLCCSFLYYVSDILLGYPVTIHTTAHNCHFFGGIASVKAHLLLVVQDIYGLTGTKRQQKFI